MKNLYFDDFGDLACSVADTYDSLESEDFEDVAVIAKYDEARQIVRDLVCIGYDIHSIELHEVDLDGYNPEYVVSLYDDEVWCEPMLRENGYLDEYAPVVYVMGNCSSKVIPYCKGKTVYEVTVGDYDCDECECDCQKDEKLTTSTSSATYKINNKEVTKDEFDKEFEKFEEKYLDNIRDMILSYCEFMDEVNEWRKLFRW